MSDSLTVAVIAGSASAITAVVSISLTQLFTYAREERIRLLCERRETYLGALDALNRLHDLVFERDELQEEVFRIRTQLDHSSEQEDSKTCASEDALSSIDDLESQISEKYKRLLELKFVQASLRREVHLWSTKVELSGSQSAYQAFKLLISSEVTEYELAERAYIRAARLDLYRLEKYTNYTIESLKNDFGNRLRIQGVIRE